MLSAISLERSEAVMEAETYLETAGFHTRRTGKVYGRVHVMNHQRDADLRRHEIRAVGAQIEAHAGLGLFRCGHGQVLRSGRDGAAREILRDFDHRWSG